MQSEHEPLDIDDMQRATAQSAAEGRRVAAEYQDMLRRWREAGAAPFSRVWH